MYTKEKKKSEKSKEKNKLIASNKILSSYSKLVKNSVAGFLPTRPEMLSVGVSRDQIRAHFGNMEGLYLAASTKYPEIFDSINSSALFKEANHDRLVSQISKYRKFLITTAVAGCQVHTNAFKTANFFCAKINAKLLILPSEDQGTALGWQLDKRISKESIVFSDIPLNSNIFISSIKLSAKSIDPSTGLDRIGQKNGTFIYASPKQRLKFTPVSNAKLPHAEMTTGAITMPNYTPLKYMNDRTAYIANHDHVMGAIVVEVDHGGRYHFRQVQFDSKGRMVDLGKMYDGSKKTVTEYSAEAFTLGDWHSGETDPTAKAAWKDVVNTVKPKRLFIHDGFNGLSVNHHEKHRQLRRAILSTQGLLNLEKELKTYGRDMNELAGWKHIKEVVVVRSNHDEFIDRWLDEGDWAKDQENYKTALKLATAVMDGCNTLEYACSQMDLANFKKIKWLKIDEDFIIGGVQHGAHGHKGPNGSRGSLRGMERAYGSSNTGHAHSPEILRRAWQAGTSSYLNVDYNKGPSSWFHSSILTYPNGMRQNINSVGGEWRLEPNPELKKLTQDEIDSVIDFAKRVKLVA
jgi:hypothetical protein